MKYKALLAYDMPCYLTVYIEADSPEEADVMATRILESNDLDLGEFDPDFAWIEDLRVVSVKEEHASDKPSEKSPAGL